MVDGIINVCKQQGVSQSDTLCLMEHPLVSDIAKIVKDRFLLQENLRELLNKPNSRKILLKIFVEHIKKSLICINTNLFCL